MISDCHKSLKLSNSESMMNCSFRLISIYQSTRLSQLFMTKAQRQQQNEKDHSQTKKPQSSRLKKKPKHRQITHYFNKVPRPSRQNIQRPLADKSVLDQLHQQSIQLQQRQKQLIEQREELSLKLENQKDEHERMMSRLRNAIVHELKITTNIERTLNKRREGNIMRLEKLLEKRQRDIKLKRDLIEANKQNRFQMYFLQKQLKNAEEEQNRLQIQLANEREMFRLSQQEDTCYLAKEGWPILGKRYLSLSLIGKGGFSEVYQAYDLQQHLPVAVKLSEVEHLLAGRGNKVDYLKHIKREYEVHKRLSHPNIVNLLEVLEVDNAICIVLQHCEGPTLAQILRSSRKLPQFQAKIIIRQLLSVIGYLSAQRIVHYDLKPQNIMFQKGVLKVLDFGICKIIDTEHSKMALTSQGVGTYCYLPPETFASSNPLLSNKVDIWSLGVIFYEILYGFRPGTRSHELNEQGQLIFPDDVEVNEQAKAFIQGCLKSNLRERFDPFAAQRHPYFQQS